jgi:hypothetical protein
MNETLLRAEAIRVYQRYAVEVVEPLNLCPWARRARLEGHVTHRVVLADAPTPDDVLLDIEGVARDPDIHVALLLFPRITLDAREFRRFASSLRQVDAARHPPGQTPLFMADFHPLAPLDPSSASRLVAFIRRTPDPTIQLVRSDILDAVRKNDPGGTVFMAPETLASGAWPDQTALPLHLRIAEANLATLENHGFERMSALLDDIRRDRDEAYARLERSEPDRPG